MNTAAETLLAFWEDPRNIPFKNSLISSEPSKDGDEPTTCMCAQGQALYKIGGYTEDDLRSIAQDKADREVARLLDISVAHSVLLRSINDGQPGAPSDVLTSPEKYLGKNCHAVMKFWWFVDGLSQGQWKEVVRRYDAIDGDAGIATVIAANGAWNAAGIATVNGAWIAANGAWNAARIATVNGAGYGAVAAAGYATHELIEGIDDPVFVPLFADLAS
jgi:hypothetical protein